MCFITVELVKTAKPTKKRKLKLRLKGAALSNTALNFKGYIMRTTTKINKKRNKTLKERYALKTYDELDVNIVELVKVLNSFDGIYTIGSCGGHSNPKPYQLPERRWEVLFKIEPTADLLSIEFIVWSINNMRRFKQRRVWIEPHSFTPILKKDQYSLYFALEGEGVAADEIAMELESDKVEFYFPF